MIDPEGQAPRAPAPTRASIGRADLLWIVARRAPEDVIHAAVSLGFAAPVIAPALQAPLRSADGAVAPEEIDEPAPPSSAQGPAPAPAAALVPALPVPFYRAERIRFVDPASSAPVISKAAPLTRADPALKPGSLFATPRPDPLAAWSALWPLLHDRLPSFLLGRDPDVAAYVRAVSRGDELRCIPRRARRVWTARVSVWIDRSRRLVPFWSDQDQVTAALRGACGRSGLQRRFLEPLQQYEALEQDGSFLPGFVPDPAIPVLVLGDLGAYGDRAEQAAWLRTARLLRARGVRVSALVPCPLARLDPELVRAWAAIPWERHRRSRVSDPQVPPSTTSALSPVDRLLRLLSPASLVQPGLLRALRRLLPEADASTEADLWRHPQVRAADASGLILDPQAALRLREAFAGEEAEDKALRARVSEVIHQWHERLPASLLLGETLTWVGLGLKKPPGEEAEARRLVAGLEASALAGARGQERDGALGAALRGYARKLLPPLPRRAYDEIPELLTVLAAAMEGVERPYVPEGMSPRDLAARLGPPREEPSDWRVYQRLNALVFERASGGSMVGSPVVTLPARGRLWVRRSEEQGWEPMVLEEGLRVPLHPGERMDLHTELCEVVIGSGTREGWASAMGRDRYGLWAEAEIRGVKQRFRWVPPGRFWMGSPASEEGRYKREGPRQQVTWSEGRWMADTPVTQALWEAVMGSNPSRFKSPERPVEQVSWEDCQVFLKRLEDVAPGLAARLPTEAEWEYACRAGTETATWLGDLKILGERHAPLLDTIAWYGGNSGKGFDLKEGLDSSAWRDKQHDHQMAGTRKVREKDPNPWGLYDMLGNVWEWCGDHGDWPMKLHGDRPVVDPERCTSGSSRVFRGGSWVVDARRVRAAFRDADPPGDRSESRGFRLARGLAPSRGAEAQSRQASTGAWDAPSPRKRRG